MSTEEIVVDSSVVIALVTPESASERVSRKLADYDYFHILDLNYYEVANGIGVKVVRKELTKKEGIEAFTNAVKVMDLYAIHNFSEIIANAIAISLETGITSYDGAFIALAREIDAKLLTLDAKLAAKLRGTKYYKFVEELS
jgi:Predicted nucleic acid-binding protein, contains PIN domain